MVFFVVVTILSLFLRPPFASGAAFTAPGSCRSLFGCDGQRRLQSRSCSYRPTLFLNNADDDKVDWENANDEKIYSLRDLLRILSEKDIGAGLDDLKRQEKSRLALDLGRRFVTSIMNATVDPIPNSNGMSVVRNVYKLETGETRHIILRNITTSFWQACIDTVNIRRIRVAAVGTPGIGKTTSTPWLIRMLLEQGQTVVYKFRTEDKSGWYHEFVPELRTNNSEVQERKVAVNIYPETLNADDIPSNKLSTTYYIVDPGESKDNCNPPAIFPAKVIIVSSPDSGHWGGSGFIKDRDSVRGKFRYFPTWSYEELLIAWPILRPDMTENEVRDRFRQFGGVPRHIFREDIDDLLEAQDMAVAAASPMQGREIALGRMKAFDRFGEHTKSALLAFRLSGDDAGTFGRGESYIVSDLVFEKFYAKFQQDLWNVMLNLGPNGGGGIIFETITRYMMSSLVPPNQFECRRCVGTEDEYYENFFWKTLGTGNKDVRQVVNPTMAATALANVVFHPIIPNHPLFDFVYKDLNGHFHFFQTTIGKKHKANATKITKLEQDVGGASNMTFYILVPSTIFPKFVTTPVKPAVLCNFYHVSIPKPEDPQSGAATDDEQDLPREDQQSGAATNDEQEP